MDNLWNYSDSIGHIRESQPALVGLDVEGLDGGIGKIVEESLEIDSSHLVIDTGFWILGTKRLVPAGVVTKVDLIDGKVWINMTKEQVKDSPEYIDPADAADASSPEPFTGYYNGYPWL